MAPTPQPEPSTTALRSRGPLGLLARVVAWPTLALLLSGAAAAPQMDGLGGGFLGLVVLVNACGGLAATDATVLRPGAFVLVWSAILVVVGVAFDSGELPGLVQGVQLLAQGLVQLALPELPPGFPITTVVLVVPVVLGALVARRPAGADLPSTFGPLGPVG